MSVLSLRKRLLLPGAPGFSDFLERTVDGDLSVSEPFDRKEGAYYHQHWGVSLNGGKIGDYSVEIPEENGDKFNQGILGRFQDL